MYTEDVCGGGGLKGQYMAGSGSHRAGRRDGPSLTNWGLMMLESASCPTHLAAGLSKRTCEKHFSVLEMTAVIRRIASI